MSRTSKNRRDLRRRNQEKKRNKKEDSQDKNIGQVLSLCMFAVGIILVGALISGPFWYELLVKPPGATRIVSLFPLVLGPFFGLMGIVSLICAIWIHLFKK